MINGVGSPLTMGAATVAQAAASDRPVAAAGFRSRIAYAAAPVMADPWGDTSPGASSASIDWDATLGFRHELWSCGFGVADAMDTAQRGMGLDWPAARELIARSGVEARAAGGRLACGAGTDQLDLRNLPSGQVGLRAVTDAYLEQIGAVVEAGATVVLMASRALAATARTAQDYLQVYDELLGQVRAPVILHWLGPAFDAALSGYWGSQDVDAATATVLELIRLHPGEVDGVKLSLLDADHEVTMRSQLPRGVRMYTGDDYHYPELIVGDAQGYSDALLGAITAVYPIAARALTALDAGDTAAARTLLDSTLPLARHLFETPTQYYKTGIAFLCWLNGFQPGFAMVGGAQSGRSLRHLLRIHELAGEVGLLRRPELADARLESLLRVHGEVDPREVGSRR